LKRVRLFKISLVTIPAEDENKSGQNQGIAAEASQSNKLSDSGI
jgi:hypothetical protein